MIRGGEVIEINEHFFDSTKEVLQFTAQETHIFFRHFKNGVMKDNFWMSIEDGARLRDFLIAARLDE